MNDSLAYNLTFRDGIAIISLQGSADITAANQLNNQLEKLTQQDKAHIIVELRELEFICSMALGSLISAHKKCRQNGGDIKLIQPQPAVVKVLKITQLDELFEIYDSVDSALETIT